ncbi:MAG TPA: hypothetical protein VEX38_02300 [Fimbriimonadaceae bacterium]|nr:hypothetical protein [Fimbriimonadaceae bacterium]
MENRVLLWTAPDRVTGEMYAEMLRERGVPVVASLSLTGTEMFNPNAMTDLWLEDERLLNEASVRRTIEEVLPEYAGHPEPLDGLDSDEIS